jgi:hypothetical protein
MGLEINNLAFLHFGMEVDIRQSRCQHLRIDAEFFGPRRVSAGRHMKKGVGQAVWSKIEGNVPSTLLRAGRATICAFVLQDAPISRSRPRMACGEELT